MPLTYTIDVELGLIHTIVTGDISDQEFRVHIQRIANEPVLHAGMNVLADCRAVVRFDVTAQTIRETIEIVRSHQKFAANQVAIAVARDAMYGMARMYQILAEAHLSQVEIFRDIDEATAWLGLPPGTA